MNIRLLLSVCCVALATVSANASAALIDRGNGLIFDDDLGITWLQNANLAATETFGVGGINPDGAMTWVTANAWIAAMNAVVNSDGSKGYGGFETWRLPTTIEDPDCFGPDCDGSEMGHLFYIEGITSATPGAYFENVQNDYYWSGTEYVALPENLAWSFSFETGEQDLGRQSDTNYNYYAWAVHDGDIGVVPVPAAAWLFISGLIGMVGFARRQS